MADEPRRTASLGRDGPGILASNKAGWSTELPSIESVVIDGRRRIVYNGPSMNPTLREPDLLWVESYGNRPVRPGDVVCFKSPEKDTNIVHRVTSVRGRGTGDGGPKDGIRTRGDNNPGPDLWVLGADSLMGRVVVAQRGPRRRPIPGGRTGRMVASSVRLREAVWRLVAGVVSGAYRGLVRCGPFDFLLPGGLRPRLVCFNGRGVAIFKLLTGRRAIGRYDREHKEWQIRRPFRLFVGVQTLPDPDSSLLALRSSLLEARPATPPVACRP
ncbi:MAG: signal peptidase I [candidate division WOR-3 bacterium]|nr:signal peptidase I [candidate division WOR-3 bacterium]